MRIKDLALSPYEIEVSNVGYTLLKIGVVESDGPNQGCKKETTEGYYSRHPKAISAIIERIAYDRVMEEDQKVTLQEFLAAFEQEFKNMRDRIEKIVTKLKAGEASTGHSLKPSVEIGDAVQTDIVG